MNLEALNFCKSIGLKKVLITCLEDNISSEKVILKCGGVLEDVRYSKEDNSNIKRFWIIL